MECSCFSSSYCPSSKRQRRFGRTQRQACPARQVGARGVAARQRQLAVHQRHRQGGLAGALQEGP
jgi:hypothetical protein